VARDGDVPDGVPALIFVAVVEIVLVPFDADRIDAELVRGPPIVIRIDRDVDPVGRRVRVAACQNADNLVRF
jgi:hypothetical protein